MAFKEQKDIENADLVISHFGYWPTFHDSEIISITFERTIDKRTASASLRVYAFEMTKEVENGFYKLIKHCFVDFEIIGLTEVELDGFNHQNAVLALEFGKEGENVFCNIVSAFGVDGYIAGKSIKTKRLEPIV